MSALVARMNAFFAFILFVSDQEKPAARKALVVDTRASPVISEATH